MNYHQTWAQAVLKMKPVVIVVDTTGVKRDSDLLQVLIMDMEGKTVYQTLVSPGRYIGQTNTQWTGITDEQLDMALPLHDVWPGIAKAVEGRYVLAYGDFVQERLDDNAQYHHLPMVQMIGANLHEAAAQYIGKAFVSMNVAYATIVGAALPAYPRAAERAAAMIALMKAMAEGKPNTDIEPPF